MVQELTTPFFHGNRLLVTGATGFVGAALCDELSRHGLIVRRALRSGALPDSRYEDVVVGDIGIDTDWRHALTGIDAVVHLAARTHVMRESATDSLAEYRRVNVGGSRALANAAEIAGVRQFVFLSSIKVNGETTAGQPYSETAPPRPLDAYGVSKHEAELAVAAATSRMQTVVLRPPLIYGPGVKGNFLRLMNAIDCGLPLPLASIRNRRSLLTVRNLVDAILLCLFHPATAGQTYLVADDEGISTPELVRAIASAMKKRPRLIALPPALLRLGAAVLGKSAAASRLAGSLQINSDKIRRELGWEPSQSLAEALRLTAEWYYSRPAAINPK